MQRAFLIFGVVLTGLLAVLWATGGFAGAMAWILAQQREIQNVLAGSVRAIRGGKPGALFALLSVCFTYGVLHAAGPGHGKVLIGGYGIGRRVPILSLAGISLAASLAQAGFAVALVYTGVALLGWTRDQANGVAENIMAPVGTAAIGMVGLWLMWRGLRGVLRHRAAANSPLVSEGIHDHMDHDHIGHDHSGHVHDENCNHAHGPSLADVAALTGWRDTAALIAGIAMRPCSGALFLLILTWQMGIGGAGVAGAFAMGLGTAVVTISVAALAVWAREGALASFADTRLARVLPWFEMLAGGVVAAIALTLLRGVL